MRHEYIFSLVTGMDLFVEDVIILLLYLSSILVFSPVLSINFKLFPLSFKLM